MKKTIRDFVYMDEQALKSLFSQAFEGVIESVVQVEASEQESEESQKGGLTFSGSMLMQKVADASSRAESSILHDHMYNLLERELGSAILDPSDQTQEDCGSFKTAFLIKAKGHVQLGDYTRISMFLESFNDLGEAVFSLSSQDEISDELSRISNLEDACSKTTDRNKLAKHKKDIAGIKEEIAQLRRSKGLSIDQTSLEHLQLVTKTFLPDLFEVTLYPSSSATDIVFRGILEKGNLRINPEYLRTLHGGYPAHDWTMVGQVTCAPMIERDATHPGERFKKQTEDAETGSMRDALRGILEAYYSLETHFVDSKELAEIVVKPLAIYRETIITIPDN